MDPYISNIGREGIRVRIRRPCFACQSSSTIDIPERSEWLQRIIDCVRYPVRSADPHSIPLGSDAIKF